MAIEWLLLLDPITALLRAADETDFKKPDDELKEWLCGTALVVDCLSNHLLPRSITRRKRGAALSRSL